MIRFAVVLLLGLSVSGNQYPKIFDKTQYGCEKRQLKCTNKECLRYNKFCDGKQDCKDGSDEYDCFGSNPSRAPYCDEAACKLPHCYCSNDGRRIPGGLSPKETPQMVMLTFDDAVHEGLDDEILEILHPKFVNPNGCTAKGTFYVSNTYTDYTLVHRAHRMGHEIGSHSISHTPESEYWKTLDTKGWMNEMVGQRRVLSKFANITEDEIRGMRVPLLAHGGNNMFEMIKSSGFLYDSSISASYYGLPLWPYTLDYRMNHECLSDREVCPSRSFPGVWEIPINQMDHELQAKNIKDPKTGRTILKYPNYVYPGCGMIDSCHLATVSPDHFFRLLTQEFFRRYNGNRAPMGLYMHAASFKGNKHLKAPLRKFIRALLEMPDVYFVRMSDVIEWMMNPVPVGERLNNFAPWKVRCQTEDYWAPTRDVNDRCYVRDCKYHNVHGRVSVCNVCPKKEPSVFNWKDI